MPRVALIHGLHPGTRSVTVVAVNVAVSPSPAHTPIASATRSSAEPPEMDLSGASSVKCRDNLAGDTTFDLAGASSVTCTSIKTGDVKLDLAGASRLELPGSGGNADIKAEGASSVRLGNFPVGDADVNLSGASNGTVNVSGTLDVNLAGSSDLTYLGEPRLGVTDMAGGSIRERGD